MNEIRPVRKEYLDRLRDLLPSRDSGQVVQEVEAMIDDRVESAERDGVSASEAERRALAALGAPEVLADRLVAQPITIDLPTRRSFVRWLWVLFAGHLLLSVILTAAGSEGPAVPGILAPLSTTPLVAFASGVLAIFLMDVGAVFVAFALVGNRRASRPLAFRTVIPAWGRRDSVLSLVVLAVLAAVFNPPLRDAVFAIRHGATTVPILAPDLLALTWAVDALLGLAALRHVVLLLRGRFGPVDVGLDVLGTAGTIALLVAALVRPDYVRLPGAIDSYTAGTLEDLATRGLLLLFVISAFFLSIRLVRRILLFRHVL